MAIQVKRAYETPTRSDGYRVLVDRVWPRGVKKQQLELDIWLKQLAPSTPLRKWFGHDPAKWTEFKRRYFRELAEHDEDIRELRKKAKKGRVTLVFAAKDTEFNNAVALRHYLRKRQANESLCAHRRKRAADIR
jgi:uncharacterized protein YeaO (DUF488 family)